MTNRENRWSMEIELTFDINPEDIKKKFPDDREVDFRLRALDRVKKHLDNLIRGGFIKHYHVVKPPKRVVEFD